MNNNSLKRMAVVLAITVISLWLIAPTVRYFLAVSGVAPVSPDKLAELKKDSVPLGLDLQGGVDVLLAVDTDKTRQNKIEDFREQVRKKFADESPAIDGTVETTSGTAAINVTVDREDQVRAANNILTQMTKESGIFDNFKEGELKAKTPLTLNISPEYLKQDAAATVDSTINSIRNRIDSLGVTQPVIVKQGSDRIRVQIPGEGDPQRALSNIIKPAVLEFRGVYTAEQPGPDGKFNEDSASVIDVKTGKPLEGKAIPPGYEVVPFKRPSLTPDTKGRTISDSFILVRKRAEMTGSGLKDSRVSVSHQNELGTPQTEVVVEFNREGAARFADVSEKYINKPLAVMLDKVVYTAPTVNGRIDQGSCSITGGFNQEEARDLSLVLKAGALPAELITKDQRTVEATLGADSISKSVMALTVGSIAIAIYMIIYYGIGGVIAVLAVILNVILIVAFMTIAKATLTLSGIGGILLTVGMAVDANILIYERIREELKDGKSLKNAIELGFGRAFAVIFDANLTTLICGVVLLQFGVGSVKGFALSLNIGIIATLFTGLFVTRSLVYFWFEKIGPVTFGKLSWFHKLPTIDFVGKRKFNYTFSFGLCLAAFLFVMPFVHGSNWGVDFEGGLLTEVTTTKSYSAQDVQGKFEDWRVQKVSGTTADGKEKFLVRTKMDDTKQTIQDAKNNVSERLNTTMGDGNYTVVGSEAVSNEVGKEFTVQAIKACIFASIGILIYIAFRFEFIFGFAAVIALFHDIVIIYGIFNLLGSFKLAGEVTLDVISALLVILGYCVNDTIIIFDRVRENKKLHPLMNYKDLINLSVNESLNRTVMTVSTVVFVLIVMLLLGGSGLYDFALVLLIGIIKGTYSSCFIASSLLYDFLEKAKLKGQEAKQVKKA